jgi:hypothetical protein
MSIHRNFAGLALAFVLVAGGCTTTQEQIDALQASYDQGMAQIDQLEADLAELESTDPRVTEILTTIETIQAELALLGPEIASLEPGTTAWIDLLKILGIAIAGFVPGGAVAIPFIRSAAAVSKSVFTSIDAGGGPADPAAAKTVLSANPKAYSAFKAYKAAKKSVVS